MLICLSCPKNSKLQSLSAANSPLHHDGIASPRPIPRREAQIKAFTAQLKDMVMKFSSGACRNCRLCSNRRNDHDKKDTMSRSSGMDASDDAAASSFRQFSPSEAHQFGELSPTPYDHLLPTAPRRRSQRRNKNSVFPATPKRSNSRCSRHSCDKKTESSAHREEWVAQVEPGVMITLVALPGGSNDLKRIRFSRELFSKWQAQLWWTENCDTVHELYTVSRSCTEVGDSSPISSCSSLQDEEEEALRNTPETLSTIDSAHTSPSRIDDYLLLHVSSSAHPSSRNSPCSRLSAAAPHAVLSASISTDQAHEHTRESGYDASFSCSSS